MGCNAVVRARVSPALTCGSLRIPSEGGRRWAAATAGGSSRPATVRLTGPSRSRSRRLTRLTRAANGVGRFDPSEITIEGLTPLDQICDEFVCKSSPAVESSLRQIATDLVAIREEKRSLLPFANDVAYDDGARRFTGREGFTNHAYIADNVEGAKAAVEAMRMDGVDRATIVWRLQGRNKGGRVDVRVVTELTMNLITGRATEVVETWNLEGCDASAGAFVSSSRTAAAAPKNLADAADKLGKDLRNMLGSLEEGGNDDIQVDPNDPMKFFQNANTPQDDYLQIALFASVIYLIFQLLSATQTLN